MDCQECISISLLPLFTSFGVLSLLEHIPHSFDPCKSCTVRPCPRWVPRASKEASKHQQKSPLTSGRPRAGRLLPPCRGACPAGMRTARAAQSSATSPGAAGRAGLAVGTPSTNTGPALTRPVRGTCPVMVPTLGWTLPRSQMRGQPFQKSPPSYGKAKTHLSICPDLTHGAGAQVSGKPFLFHSRAFLGQVRAALQLLEAAKHAEGAAP